MVTKRHKNVRELSLEQTQPFVRRRCDSKRIFSRAKVARRYLPRSDQSLIPSCIIYPSIHLVGIKSRFTTIWLHQYLPTSSMRSNASPLAMYLESLVPSSPSYTHTSQVGDALVKINVTYGGYLHGLKMFSPNQQAGTTKLFGPAYTVQMVDANDTTSPKPSQHFVDGIKEGEVVFISQPKGFYSACWGGLMSTRAKYLGAQGVIVDGNFRDLNEHREMGFPVSSVETKKISANCWKTLTQEQKKPGLCKSHFGLGLQHFYQSFWTQCCRAVYFGDTEEAIDYSSWRLDTCGSGWSGCCSCRACGKVLGDL